MSEIARLYYFFIRFPIKYRFAIRNQATMNFFYMSPWAQTPECT